MSRRQEITVAIEEVFVRSPDGTLFSPSGFSEEFWQRYTGIFEKVTVVGRVSNGGAPASAVRIPDFVKIRALPAYKGLMGSLLFLPVLFFYALRLPKNQPCVLRAPGVISLVFGSVLAARRSRFGIELVGDIDDVLRSILPRHLYTVCGGLALFITRGVVKRATSVAYVTQSTLQAKYPPGKGATTASYSSVQIDDIVKTREPPQGGERLRLISVGTMKQRYKGFDVLINAVRSLIERGVEVEAKVIGDGEFIHEYRALATSVGVGAKVSFLGRLPRSQVLLHMDEADVFVSASRTEGLPRVIIEAMSRGLPVVSTPVGGCAELVLSEHLFAVDDVGALVSRLEALANYPDLWRSSMRHSCDVAEQYLAERMATNRKTFLQSL